MIGSRRFSVSFLRRCFFTSATSREFSSGLSPLDECMWLGLYTLEKELFYFGRQVSAACKVVSFSRETPTSVRDPPSPLTFLGERKEFPVFC